MVRAARSSVGPATFSAEADLPVDQWFHPNRHVGSSEESRSESVTVTSRCKQPPILFDPCYQEQVAPRRFDLRC